MDFLLNAEMQPTYYHTGYDTFLYNKDCLELMKIMPDECVDIVVTDPPYKISSGGGQPKEGIRYCGGMLNRYAGADADNVQSGKVFEYNDIKFKEWLPEVYRVLKERGVCYIFVNARNLKELWTESENAGFVYQQLIVWDKGNSTPNKYYMNSYELVLMVRNGSAKPIRNMGTSNLQRTPNIKKNTKQHPTEKPVELMKTFVNNSSCFNDIIFDPFMGSASTAIACMQTARRFIGCEIDPKYYNVAIDRITEEVNRPYF